MASPFASPLCSFRPHKSKQVTQHTLGDTPTGFALFVGNASFLWGQVSANGFLQVKSHRLSTNIGKLLPSVAELFDVHKVAATFTAVEVG
jgi:hypothetical protein